MSLIKSLQHKYALSETGAKDMIKACVSVIFSDLALMLPVGILYKLVSDLVNKTEFTGEKIAFYVISCVAALLVVFITTGIQYKATFFTTYKESGVRRVTLAEHLRKIPLSFFGKRDLTDLTSAIMSDCAMMETASSHWIPQLIGSLISTVLIAISLFFFNVKMAAASLWVLPVALVIVLFSSKLNQALSKKRNDAVLRCSDGIQECLESMKELKSNNYEEKYLVTLREKICEVEKRTIFTELGASIFVTSAQMLLKLGIATTALVGGKLIVSRDISILTFFMFLLVVSRVYEPMNVALQNVIAIVSLSVRTDRMNEILEQDVQTGKDTIDNKGYDISFENVEFAYDKSEKILSGISFTAKQGEVTALIGPSGGGKTTVSRLAARFWDISEGRITVGGEDISKINPETLLSLYSIVFQDVTLFNNTVMENIRIGKKDATDEEVMEAAKLANCTEFISKMPKGFQTEIGENGCELSGGQRQRLSIARAFLKDAPIILMDEATASLDVDNETLIQESLSRLIKNKTVLIIAHRMRTVANADKIVVLKNGKIAESGTPAELMNKGGEYASMVKLQTISQDWAMACHKQHLSNDYLVKFGRLVLHNKTERTDTNDRCDV